MAEGDTKRGNVSTLLSAATGTGAGTSDLDYSLNKNITFQIIGADTSVGTVVIEASLDGASWGVISTNAISANGSTFVAISGQVYKYLRPNVSAYTSGNFTVKMVRQS